MPTPYTREELYTGLGGKSSVIEALTQFVTFAAACEQLDEILSACPEEVKLQLATSLQRVSSVENAGEGLLITEEELQSPEAATPHPHLPRVESRGPVDAEGIPLRVKDSRHHYMREPTPKEREGLLAGRLMVAQNRFIAPHPSTRGKKQKRQRRVSRPSTSRLGVL